MKFDRTCRLALTMLVLTCGSIANAQVPPLDSARQINEANELLRGGDVDGAIHVYERIDSPGKQPLADYNRAVALYHKGERELAAELFRSVATSADEQLAANARYNLGNLHYEQALSAAQEDKQAAIGKLTTAISHYRSSLRLRASDDDARANIELAARLIDQLRQQEAEEQQQKQDQQNEQSEDQNQEPNPDDSNSDSKPQEEGSQEKQQDPEQQDPEQQEPEQSSPQESNAEQDPQENSAESGENNTQSEAGQPDESQSKDGEPKESDASESASDGNPSQDSKGDTPSPEASAGEENQPSQDDAASATESGSEDELPQGELTSQQQSDAESDAATSASKEKQGVTNRMTPEEARKLLQAIRDRDMLRRYGREAAARANRRLQVDKDW